MYIYDKLRKKSIDSTEIIENSDESRYEVVVEYNDDMYEEVFKVASDSLKNKRYVLIQAEGERYGRSSRKLKIAGHYDTFEDAQNRMNELYYKQFEKTRQELTLKNAGKSNIISNSGRCGIENDRAYIGYNECKPFEWEIDTIYLDMES